LDYQDQKIDSQMSILKHVTKNFTQTLEDCGYEEGTLHNIMLKLPKTNSELAIKNQSSVFWNQLKKMTEQIKNLIWEVENVNNQRMQFDHRLTYLESVAKNIVTQAEYRNDTIKFEEKLLNKTAKAVESMLEELGKNKDYLDQKLVEFQDKINNSEMKTIWKIQDWEDLLKQRVSQHYLDNLLNNLNDKLLKHVERTSDRNIMRMDQVHKELTSKFNYIEKQMEEDRKVNLERENLFTFKKDTDSLKKHLLTLESKVHDYNTEHDDTLSDFKKNILDFNKRLTDVAKNLSSITKEHEDLSNAASIASAAQDLLNQCNFKLETTDKEIKKLQKILEIKVNSDEFYKQIQRKMDRQEVVNLISSDEEKKRIKECVQKETAHLDKTIQNMERYWDAKLVRLRQDLNVHQLIRRLDEKASHSETATLFEENKMRIEGWEEHLQKLGQDMQYVANSFTSIRKYVADVKKIHADCTKSISWLSWGNDNKNFKFGSLQKSKESNVKLPGFLVKGRQPLEDQSLVDYEIGLNVFTGKSFRPKSAKKFRTKSKIKSNVRKLGNEISRFSRAQGIIKTKENDSYSPQALYNSYIDNENYMMKHNKSVNSLQDTNEQNENSFCNQHLNETN
jgi:hypothetical protein